MSYLTMVISQLRALSAEERPLGGAPIREETFLPFSGFLQNENK